MIMLLRKLDKLYLETVFLIAFCRLTADKRQWKILFLEILICSRRLLRFLVASYPV